MSKILVEINSCLNKGSTGRITEQIGLLAQKRGWTCYVVHGPRYKEPSQLKNIEVVDKFQEKCHIILTRLFDYHGLASYFATKKLIKKVKKINPDLIQLHNIHGYYINYRVLFAYLKKANLPVVWTFHDCWAFTGHCAHFDIAGCEKWRNEGCNHCPLKKSYPSSMLFDGSKRNYRIKRETFTSIMNNLTIVPVSHWIAGLVKQSFMKDTNMRIIHNGVDLNIFHPLSASSEQILRRKYNLQGKHIIMGCATSWTKWKGYYDFIALRRLLDFSYELMLVGVKPQQKIEIEKLGLRGVCRTENVQELAELYSLSSVFVNPTYSDTFPTVNLEALACGTPVVTYRVGGSPETIDKGTGIVVERGDVSALAIACQKSVYDGKPSVLCRNRAELFYDKNECFANYIKLYEKLLINVKDND